MVDDFVVLRSDGVHAYQLAVVIDDADQEIGEVVRGDDLAESTPRQILLQRLLGLAAVSYAHVPLVMGPGGARLAKRDRGAALTDREREVVALVASGLSNDEIARQLVVSPLTAKTHVSRAMVKLSARDRAQLVVLAYEHGLTGS